jgi:large subunit ribosomal protein L10
MDQLSANKAKKAEKVTELTQKIGKAKAIILADYRGIKHKQLEDLRKLLKKSEAEFVVAKNRLMLRALGDKAQGLEKVFEDTTSAVFAYADEVAPLKELLKFFKAVGLGKTKAGLLGNQVLSDTEVTRLSTLPSRTMLLAKLVGQLNAPVQGLHYALSWNLNRFVQVLDGVRQKKSL